MKPTRSKALAKMHPIQIDWIKAKALHDTFQEINRQKWKDNTITDKDLKEENDALKILRAATAQLLGFGHLAGQLCAKKHGKEWTPDLQKLYQDDLSSYMMTDELPTWWQSKLIKSIISLDASQLPI